MFEESGTSMIAMRSAPNPRNTPSASDVSVSAPVALPADGPHVPMRKVLRMPRDRTGSGGHSPGHED